MRVLALAPLFVVVAQSRQGRTERGEHVLVGRDCTASWARALRRQRRPAGETAQTAQVLGLFTCDWETGQLACSCAVTKQHKARCSRPAHMHTQQQATGVVNRPAVSAGEQQILLVNFFGEMLLSCYMS